MEPASEQFKASDVTIWGIVAMACGAFALVSANIGALVPAGVVNAMHSPRIEAAGIEQLQAQITRLEGDSQRVAADSDQLRARFELAMETQSAAARRIGALEVSLPNLLEGQQKGAGVDTSIITAGIAQVPTQTFDADGGSVTVSQKPMTVFDGFKGAVGKQPLPTMPAATPAYLSADRNAFGLAVGPAITDENAKAAWEDVSLKMGALFIGLGPLVSEAGDGGEQHLIIGPLPDIGQANDLCQRIEKVSIRCLPVPFAGKPL